MATDECWGLVNSATSIAWRLRSSPAAHGAASRPASAVAANAADKRSITIVQKTHNLLGRVHMAFVAPMHRRIVPATLARLEQGQDAIR
ncbi:DUF2867 domain-containing protein [Metallibacterium sp.]|uniref:DUF2867 domain-containing protein n=1 Tax=Metallibacterium sp. TaxID=2940281 RepID=UPI00262FEAE5|nr:DUF2867 domain-containing protein [Metallibacterium sp.]